MPVLRTNYRRKCNAARAANTRLDRMYMGPVNFSLNAYTNLSGVAVFSAQTLQSLYNIVSLKVGTKIVVFDITPISFSTYSYSGIGGSLRLAAGSMWASDSLYLFVPSLSDVVISASSPAIARITAIVCSGP